MTSDDKPVDSDRPAELSESEIERAVGGDGAKSTGKVEMHDFTFTKKYDKASPTLS